MFYERISKIFVLSCTDILCAALFRVHDHKECNKSTTHIVDPGRTTFNIVMRDSKSNKGNTSHRFISFYIKHPVMFSLHDTTVCGLRVCDDMTVRHLKTFYNDRGILIHCTCICLP